MYLVASSEKNLRVRCMQVMKEHHEHDGVQCNACLALMALVRGEGDVCQANQWHIAKAGAVEAIVLVRRGGCLHAKELLCC